MAAYIRRWEWAGFTASAKTGQAPKTLWDWLQLLVIPVGLSAVAFALNAAQSNREQRREDRRAVVERSIASDQRREDALRLYLQQMSDLMLDRGLLAARAGSESRAIARTLTLGVLRRLDGRRKGFVLQFLAEARLIGPKRPRIDMRRADLRGAIVRGSLRHANFFHADLWTADFRGSSLYRVSFRQAVLANADFSTTLGERLVFGAADMTRTNFSRASLRKTSFLSACLIEARFAGANLSDTDFEFAYGLDSDFSKAHLYRVNFGEYSDLLWKVDFAGTVFVKARRPRRETEFFREFTCPPY